MVYVWCMYGVSMVYVWCIWCMYGVCMVYVWCMYGVYMVYVWCMYGVCMLYVWCMYIPTHQQSLPGLPGPAASLGTVQCKCVAVCMVCRAVSTKYVHHM